MKFSLEERQVLRVSSSGDLKPISDLQCQQKENPKRMSKHCDCSANGVWTHGD